MINRFTEWLKKRRHSNQYTYGHIINLDGSVRHKARLDNKTGMAQWVLWKAGEQGHTEDFWHNMGYGWELQFKEAIEE